VTREHNAEVVRRSFDAFESFDMERWVADWDEAIEFDVTGYEPWAGERKHYRGHVEILEFFGAMMGGVRVLKVNVDRVEAVDDDRVIAIYTETRQAPGELPQDLDVGIVYTLRDGKMTLVRVFSSHDAALRAAGLS
jgi:ketosteroid isomerase-like protein